MKLPVDYSEMIKRQLGSEADEYFAALDKQHTRGLHINTLKITEREAEETFGGLVKTGSGCFEYKGPYENRPSIHPYHSAGAYYMQEPSAMIPIMLAPLKGDETALDMCAAPGGKSSQFALRLSAGTLVSNEIDAKRAQILKENITRMGYINVLVSSLPPKFFGEKCEACFDAVLIDAPCSGEGMFRKEPDAVRQWSAGLVRACAERQKEIVHNAVKSLKRGGLLIYSTCTFSEEEDEEISEFIATEGFEEIRISNPGFLKECARGYKIYPDRFGEGQYFAYFRKLAGEKNFLPKKRFTPAGKNEIKQINGIFETEGTVCKAGDSYFIPAIESDFPHVLLNGIYLGRMDNKRFVPSHAAAVSCGCRVRRVLNVSPDDRRIEAYLGGEEIEADVDGWCAFAVNGRNLGLLKCSAGTGKNHYPKNLRTRK